MAITNDEELKAAAAQAGDLLQQIENYLRHTQRSWTDVDEARVRFPRRVIRTAEFQRRRLPFVKADALRTNLAYTLILSDVVLWLELRTDLWGTPKEMLTKLYVFLIGTLCESITKDFLTGKFGGNYKKRNEFLVDHGVIADDLRQDLDWLWDTRNRMHLFQLDDREYVNEYNDQCRRRAVLAFRALVEALGAQPDPNAG